MLIYYIYMKKWLCIKSFLLLYRHNVIKAFGDSRHNVILAFSYLGILESGIMLTRYS